MVSVRHGESVPMRQGQTNRCQRCECEDGSLQCSNLDEDSRCPRSDPNQRPANCMTRDGEEVQHGEMRQVSYDTVISHLPANLSEVSHVLTWHSACGIWLDFFSSACVAHFAGDSETNDTSIVCKKNGDLRLSTPQLSYQEAYPGESQLLHIPGPGLWILACMFIAINSKTLRPSYTAFTLELN